MPDIVGTVAGLGHCPQGQKFYGIEFGLVLGFGEEMVQLFRNFLAAVHLAESVAEIPDKTAEILQFLLIRLVMDTVDKGLRLGLAPLRSRSLALGGDELGHAAVRQQHEFLYKPVCFLRHLLVYIHRTALFIHFHLHLRPFETDGTCCKPLLPQFGSQGIQSNDSLLHFAEIKHNKEVCNILGSVAHIVIDKEYAGYIIISDELKDDTVEAIKELNNMGIKNLTVLTGDNKYATETILKDTNIKEYYHDLLPSEKAEKFKEFSDKYKGSGSTVFVGDGINDAPVLALADVGISMGAAGSDAAIETADVVIMNDSLMKIAQAVKVAKRTKTIIWQNVIFALSIKALFIILGLFGIASMWEAVFGDVGVALLALLNSMRALK